MAAITQEHLIALKKILDDRYVGLLPDLLDRDGTTERDKEAKQISRALSAFVVQKVFDTSAQDAAFSVVDNYNDNGIDAIHYHPSSKTLALVQSKLHQSQDFGQRDAQDFEAGINLLLKQEFDTFNKNVQDRLSSIESHLDECDSIRLIVACTGNQISQHAKTRLDNLVKADDKEDERLSEKVLYMEAEDIVAFLLEEQSVSQVDVKIKIEKPQNTTGSREMVHGIIALEALVGLHNQHDKALYQKNIRYFLGSKKSDVNSAIKKTLGTCPENFVYLNNGITAICDELKTKSRSSRRFTHEAMGFSIVNGAQTIASTAEFVAQNPMQDISEAKVMFTLIQAPESGSFHKEITKARNFQNPVHVSNFVSLDERQERLRKSLRLHGFHYHYRPEINTAIHGQNELHIDDVIVALACMQDDPRHAIWLKSDQLRYRDQEGNQYNSIFEENLPAFKVINSHICYKLIRELISGYERGAYGQEKLIYRHGAFALSYVFMKQLSDKINAPSILDKVALRTLISEPLDTLRQQMVDGFNQGFTGGYGPLGFFRNMTYGVPLVTKLLQEQALLNEADSTVADRLRTTVAPIVPNTGDRYSHMKLVKFLMTKTEQL